ncbi:hypothetical protein FAF21_08695 [Staphylococcus haemolyticus]|nr:hypothetical protein HMPREF2639_07800 [Staphylococcus sp. HMSC078D05]PJM57761.1 hypothetical protein CWB84_11410 [Staphylococcus haemolyticus]RJG24424.1 hypothetical protein D5R77_11060 [Staphylococcus haemolyticus]TJX33032.1 hypothetical protein FAF21_08695 [Staphylococcus haemolyticus]
MFYSFLFSLNLKTNNVINIEFDIDQKVFHQIQKVKQMNELLRLLLSDFIFDINTKNRSLKSLWLKKLRLLRVSTTTEAYEINKKRSLQTIQNGLVTIVKSL